RIADAIGERAGRPPLAVRDALCGSRAHQPAAGAVRARHGHRRKYIRARATRSRQPAQPPVRPGVRRGAPGRGMSAKVSSNGRPSALPPRPYQFPRFERRRLANGMQVVVAPVPKLPIATAIALIDAGAVCDEPGREGIATLTAELLLEGTTDRDGAALADAFERLGASAEVLTDWDGAVVTLTAMAKNLGPAIELLGEVLRSPAFPDREIERLKAEHLAERMQLKAEPR